MWRCTLYMYHKLTIIYPIFLHYSKSKVVRRCLLEYSISLATLSHHHNEALWKPFMKLKLKKTKAKLRKVLFIFESVHTLYVHVRPFVFIEEVVCPLKSNLLVSENTTYHLEKHYALPSTHITPTTPVFFSPPSSLFLFSHSLFVHLFSPLFLNLSLPLSIPPSIPSSILFFLDSLILLSIPLPSFLPSIPWFLLPSIPPFFNSLFPPSLPPSIPWSLLSSFDPLTPPSLSSFPLSSLCPSTQYRVRRWQLLKNTRTAIGMSCQVSSWHLWYNKHLQNVLCSNFCWCYLLL